MSDFWKLSDGTDVEANDSFDIGGGNIEVIPEGAQLLAAIDEAKWDRNDSGDKYISVRWTVLQPEELANRKVFQKLWVDDLNPEKKKKGDAKAVAYRDKAKRMLMAIDANAGGKLAAKGGAPTDIDLTSSLTMKPMVIRIGVVSSLDTNTGKESSRNWVGAVGPKTNPRTSSEELAKLQASQAKAAGGRGSQGAVDDDSIPF
jgi:hypothetical protein